MGNKVTAQKGLVDDIVVASDAIALARGWWGGDWRTMRVLIAGVYDANSMLSLLWPIRKHIMPIIMRRLHTMYMQGIQFDDDERAEGRFSVSAFSLSPRGCVPAQKWPKFSGINVNMMPFRVGDVDSLPDQLKPYNAMINYFRLPKAEIGTIAYLTVHESDVKKGTSQRRPGLHTESPGFMTSASAAHLGALYRCHVQWGFGMFGAEGITGGIYMASNCPMSTRVYHCKVTDPSIVGTLGNVEHLRHLLNEHAKCSILREGEIFWMTDMTPHESIPLQNDFKRNFKFKFYVMLFIFSQQ
jgi:hypothetical protein